MNSIHACYPSVLHHRVVFYVSDPELGLVTAYAYPSADSSLRELC